MYTSNITNGGNYTQTAGDMTLYEPVNDANPTISLGSSATNRLEIVSTYNSSAQTLDEVSFKTYTTSGTSNDGRFIFEVDEVEVLRLLDSSITSAGSVTCTNGYLAATNTTTSSATEGGRLILVADDGAVMADNHRLGVIEFKGAEDTSATRSIGARIQAIARDAWDGSNNDADLEFYTTDGTTESKALTLDADNLATFAGSVSIDSVSIAAVQTSAESFADNDTSIMTSAAIDDRKIIGQLAVLRCQSFYVNDNPMVQNNLYFGNSIGHQPNNWNQPAAVGGVIGDTSSFAITGDDENWGMILPFNISKVEVQCSVRPQLGTGDDLTVAIYTGVRSTDSSADLTLTKIAHNSVNISGTVNRYTQNDVSVTTDLAKGVMLYVGVGTEDSTDMKNGRGYMTVTITRR